MPPQENFEKFDPKSCNLSELKESDFIELEKDLFWEENFFFGVFLHLTCPLALQFLKLVLILSNMSCKLNMINVDE